MDLDRAEEGRASETEAAPDAGEDGRGLGYGLAVGHDAKDVDLLRAPVGEGAQGRVGVAVGVAVAGGSSPPEAAAVGLPPLGMGFLGVSFFRGEAADRIAARR